MLIRYFVRDTPANKQDIEKSGKMFGYHFNCLKIIILLRKDRCAVKYAIEAAFENCPHSFIKEFVSCRAYVN